MLADKPRPAFRRAPVGLRRDLLRLLNAAPWAGGVERWSVETFGASNTPVAAIVAVPARNERERLGICLDACVTAARRARLPIRLTVLVNGSTDGTGDLVRERARRYPWPVTLVEADFAAPLAHAGAARRLALEVACLHAAPHTAIFTTDADARPSPTWLHAGLTHLEAGAALVCGRILADPVEAALLPRRLEEHGALEARYHRTAQELAHVLDPDPHNPWPHHGVAAGASLAIRAADLHRVGGVPLVPCGEDRLLATCVRAAGLVVRHADDVEVEVSCRVHGRASGGMADTLRYRIEHRDPLCDDSVRAAVETYERIDTRARLRACWSDPGARLAAVQTLHDSHAAPRGLTDIDAFERAWERYERLVLNPVAERVRLSDLPRELASLQALLERARATHSARPPPATGQPVAARSGRAS